MNHTNSQPERCASCNSLVNIVNSVPQCPRCTHASIVPVPPKRYWRPSFREHFMQGIRNFLRQNYEATREHVAGR